MNNLNKFLQPLNAPVTQPRTIPAMQFEDSNEVQTRNVRLSSIQLNKMQFVRYDSSTNTIIISVPITFGSAVVFSGNITKGITPSAFVKEIQIPLIMGGATGGGFNSFYTNQTTPQYMWPSRFQIDPSNYPGCTFLLEAVYRAGAGADSTRTFTMDLYDATGGAVITNSSISGSDQQGSDPTGYPLVRGTTNFRLNMTSGVRTYVLRYYTDILGSFINLYEARLIIQY